LDNLSNKQDFMDGMFDAGTIKSTSGGDAALNLFKSLGTVSVKSTVYG